MVADKNPSSVTQTSAVELDAQRNGADWKHVTTLPGGLGAVQESEEKAQTAAQTRPRMSAYEEAQANSAIARAAGSARDSNAAITPVMAFNAAADGGFKTIIAKTNAMDVAPARVDLNEMPSSAEKFASSRDYYAASGLMVNAKSGEFFAKFMAGDKEATAVIQKGLLSQRTEEGKQWGKETLAELLENRAQFQSAQQAERAAAPQMENRQQLVSTGPALPAPGG